MIYMETKKKKETTPEGKRDDNVFDIMQGVSISLFLKKNNPKQVKLKHSVMMV